MLLFNGMIGEKLILGIGEKMLEEASKQICSKVPPILLKKLFRKYQEVYLKFALIFDFYELPLIEDAIQLVENCLTEYKIDASTLKADDFKFAYFINYEIAEDYLPPDIDVVFEGSEHMPTLGYASLMEIILFPKNDEKRVENRKQVEKLIIAGVKLLDAIFNQLKNDEKTNYYLKIRSSNKIIAVESNSLFISDIYKKISSELAKNKFVHTPYVGILKGIDGKDTLIIAVNDATIVQLLTRVLT
jgi:hypothetical protein